MTEIALFQHCCVSEWDTCAGLKACSDSKYGQSWGGWMEYSMVLSLLLSVASLSDSSDSSPSRSSLSVGGQRPSVLGCDPLFPSEKTAGLWMQFCSGLSELWSEVWFRLLLRSLQHSSRPLSCFVPVSKSKRSISLFLLHSLWPRFEVFSIRVEVTLERLFCSFRAWALIPEGEINEKIKPFGWTSTKVCKFSCCINTISRWVLP